MIRLITIAIFALGALTACEDQVPTEKQLQSQKAQRAAESIDFSDNAEIDNIKNRLELTSNPGQLGFILLLNQAGQPILYTSVKGKVTSSGKRLTAPIQAWSVPAGGWSFDVAPSDEGTWGSSDPYIYFWTTTGQYIQWNSGYLYSDKPIRLDIKPLVIMTVEESKVESGGNK